jgi:uncharacterized protein YecE (DUF72 family)
VTEFLLGTSGWSYKEWIGPFYDKASKMFSHYSRFFRTAEINSTFYQYPSRATIYGLLKTAPQDFIFSAKLPQLITHEKRLDLGQKVENHLLRFLELLNPLKTSGKLGCMLIQLPPSFDYQRGYIPLQAFLEVLPDEYEFAAEFRNPSWMREETWKLLRKHNVAYCIVDEPLLPPDIHVTADFAYFRWHGRGRNLWYDYRYSEEELEVWMPRIESVQDRATKIYGYFNNHFHGYAVENCIEILEMLHAATPRQQRVKERVRRYNVQKKPLTFEKKLEAYGITIETPLKTHLLDLTDQQRLKRGMKIREEEVTFRTIADEKVIVRVRKYPVEIDVKEKTITHNCDDWRKGLSTKRLCKHLVKIFLMMSSEVSSRILLDLSGNRDEWQFQLPSDDH